jgi:hypothetical protein
MSEISGVGRVGIRNYVAPTTSLSSIVTNGLILNLDAGNVASYPGTGTTWTDLSGNGNHAILVNGTSYRSGLGGVMMFDGINDYVTNPNQITDYMNTIDIWVNMRSSSNLPIIYYGADVFDSNAWTWGMAVYPGIHGFNEGASNYPTTPLYTDSIEAGVWKNFTLVRNDNGSVKLYKNGQLMGTKAGSGTTSLRSIGDRLFIGKAGGVYGGFNLGSVKIYNRTLTSTEVAQNFEATKPRFGFVEPTYVETTKIYSIIANGLVLNLDAGITQSYSGGSTWSDLSGNGNDVELFNGATYSTLNSGTIIFDGINDYAYKSTFPQMNLSSVLTMSCWCTFADITNTRIIYSIGRDFDRSGGGGIALIGILGRKAYFSFGSEHGVVTSTMDMQQNVWYNITITADGTNTKMYINGALNNTATQGLGYIADSAGLAIGSLLGAGIPPSGGGYNHIGNVSSTQVYNRALYASEISANFNALKSRYGY